MLNPHQNNNDGQAGKTPMTHEAAARIQAAADKGYGDAGFKARAQSAAAHNANAGQTG